MVGASRSPRARLSRGLALVSMICKGNEGTIATLFEPETGIGADEVAVEDDMVDDNLPRRFGRTCACDENGCRKCWKNR